MQDILNNNSDSFACVIPLAYILTQFLVPELKDICRLHGKKVTSMDKRPELLAILSNHVCTDSCGVMCCVIIACSAENMGGKCVEIDSPDYASAIKQLSPADVRDLLSLEFE
jgi:hypothetical protein